MFKHRYFEDRIPEEQLGKTVWIGSDKFMEGVEAEWLRIFDGDLTAQPSKIGVYSRANILKVQDDSIEMDYFVNRHTRYHSIRFSIPRPVIKKWIGLHWNFDQKNDYLFVNDSWIESFWSGQISTFLLVDAVGIKKKMILDASGLLEELNCLSDEVDELSKRYPDLLFISAADNVIVKANYPVRVNHPEYDPELLLKVCDELFKIMKATLNCEAYGIFSQGFNIYNDIKLYNFSNDSNHLNMRSLGEPYRELFDLDIKIRKDIKGGIQKPCNAYFSPSFFFSLNIQRKKLTAIDFNLLSDKTYLAFDLNKVISAFEEASLGV